MWSTIIYRANEEHDEALEALSRVHVDAPTFRSSRHFDGVMEPAHVVMVLEGTPQERRILNAYRNRKDLKGRPDPVRAEVLKRPFSTPSVAPVEDHVHQTPEPDAVVEVFEIQRIERPQLREVLPETKRVAVEQAGFGAVEAVQGATIADLMKVPGIGRSTAQKLKEWAAG